MKLSDMKRLGDVIEEHRQDPQFRKEWDRTAFARAVAIRVVAYRTKTGISQRALARATGLTQPAIARLESGEHEPSLATLAKLTNATGLSFQLKVSRGGVDLSRSASKSANASGRTQKSGRWKLKAPGQKQQPPRAVAADRSGRAS